MTELKRTHKDDEHVHINADVIFEKHVVNNKVVDGAFWFSVWVDFIPETEEKPILVSGVISKDGITIEKQNQASRDATLKRLSEGFMELGI